MWYSSFIVTLMETELCHHESRVTRFIVSTLGIFSAFRKQNQLFFLVFIQRLPVMYFLGAWRSLVTIRNPAKIICSSGNTSTLQCALLLFCAWQIHGLNEEVWHLELYTCMSSLSWMRKTVAWLALCFMWMETKAIFALQMITNSDIRVDLKLAWFFKSLWL